MPWPTLLFDYSFGTPDVFGAPGQRKFWFPPAIDIAQLPAAIAARDRQDIYYEEPSAPSVVFTPLPVEDNPWEFVYPEPAAVIRPVLPGPVAARPAVVPRETVIVEGLPTEVERYEEGDFPAGSIFAPGRTWGASPAEQHDLDVEDEPVALSDILDWGLDTLAGQQPWQMGGWGGVQQQPGYASFTAGVPSVPTPSGVPGRPSTAPVTYTGGGGVNDCGNRRYVTLDRETGKISCKRRRRRRLLTNRDLADLASLKTITGGGAALNAAVIRAVR